MTLKISGNGHSQLMTILDKDIPDEMRRAVLAEIAMSDEGEHKATIDKLFESARRGQSEALTNEKLKELQGLIDELKRGPLRPATFIEATDAGGAGCVRVEVRMPNGDVAYPIIVEGKLIEGMTCGDGVLVDAQARAVLYRDRKRVEAGEVARFERRLNDDQVLVTLRDFESQVLRATSRLLERIKAHEVESGCQLLVCMRRQMALDALPSEEGVNHYRYASRDPLPDIQIAQLGDPPKFIFDVLDHFERELKNPELCRRYHLRRAITKLLVGVSGSGKTVSIEATIRAVAELMSRHVGVPVESLPNRVMRLRPADVLSKFFGSSDQRIARFFDECSEMADEKFVAPDGRAFELPVIVIIEECDSLGRQRGGEEQVYDRIQTTLLDRLDVNMRRFGSKLVAILATTNVPHLIDPAFLRRCGGTVERFDRLRRKSFAAVLEKHLAGKPIDPALGTTLSERERALLRATVNWLFDTTIHDRGQVELTYAGSAQPATWYRRDFVTAGLVDRAVQEAAAVACRAESEGQAGITREQLLAALERQIRSIVDQLSTQNVQNYLTLPDGVRVVQVRRIEQPKLSLHTLERDSA